MVCSWGGLACKRYIHTKRRDSGSFSCHVSRRQLHTSSAPPNMPYCLPLLEGMAAASNMAPSVLAVWPPWRPSRSGPSPLVGTVAAARECGSEHPRCLAAMAAIKLGHIATFPMRLHRASTLRLASACLPGSGRPALISRLTVRAHTSTKTSGAAAIVGEWQLAALQQHLTCPQKLQAQTTNNTQAFQSPHLSQCEVQTRRLSYIRMHPSPRSQELSLSPTTSCTHWPPRGIPPCQFGTFSASFPAAALARSTRCLMQLCFFRVLLLFVSPSSC